MTCQARSDVGTVVINEAVIKGEAEPEYRAERQPHDQQETATKIDLKVVNSKIRLIATRSKRAKTPCFRTFFISKNKARC